MTTDRAIPIGVFTELERAARAAARFGDQRTIDAINTRLADVNMKLVIHGKTVYVQVLNANPSERTPQS